MLEGAQIKIGGSMAELVEVRRRRAEHTENKKVEAHQHKKGKTTWGDGDSEVTSQQQHGFEDTRDGARFSCARWALDEENAAAANRY